MPIFAPQYERNTPCNLVTDGAIAQLVEQRTENPCVPGSIPGGTTRKARFQVEIGSFCFSVLLSAAKRVRCNRNSPPQGNSPEQYPGQRTTDNGSDTDHRQTGVGKHRRQKVLDELARTNVAGRQADKQAKTNAAGRQAGQRVAGEYRDKSPEANRQRRIAGGGGRTGDYECLSRSCCLSRQRCCGVISR